MNKKSIAKIFRISIIFFVMLFVATSAQVEAKTSTRKAYKVYTKKHFKGKKYPNLKCILYDINKDGTKEMILRYESGVRNAYQVYTCKKGKVKKMHKGEFSGAGSISYIKGKKSLIISFSNGASDNGYYVYKVKGNKLKKVKSYWSTYDEVKGKATYTAGKKKISAAEYNRFIEKLKPI